MRVYQMSSTRSHNPVPNQFIIEADDGVYFQSYRTMIAKRNNGKLTLTTGALDYSRTTSKYLSQFTGMNTAELRKGIKDGSILEAKL